MNALLIYNSNVPYTLKDSFNEFGTSVSFVVLKDELTSPSFTIDKKMNDFLLNEGEIEQKQYDVIFIPYSLSEENYTEFLGLRLAYHIRLTPEFNNIQTPIVFYGLDTPWEINKLSNLGQILFTSNIFTTDKISADNFKKKIEDIKAQSSSSHQSDNLFLKDFTAKIRLKAPGNYKSHHSIDNELALFRWSTYLNCDNKIEEVKNNLKTNLYFKYINAINPIEIIETGKKINIQGKSNVLLIDDEADKGWSVFYNSFFEFSPSVNFSSLEIDFKGLSQNEVIEEAKKKVKDFKADVVLLDLRLRDADFQENILPDNLSGIKILNEIKEFNRGIQVIITTASDKVWNYRASNKANGYIIKSRSSEVSADMKHLYFTIEKSINKSKILIPIYKSFELIKSYSYDLSDNFISNLNKNLSICFDLLEKSFDVESEKHINYAYLQLYLIIEEFIKEENIFEEGQEVFVKSLSKEICVAKRENSNDDNKDNIECAITLTKNGKYEINKSSFTVSRKFRFDTNFIVSSILIFKYGNTNSSVKKWTSIYQIRNGKAAHAHISKKQENSYVTFDEFKTLVEFLEYFLDNNNESANNIEKGLKASTLNESLEKALIDPRFKRKKKNF